MLFWIDGHLEESSTIRFPLLSHSLHYGSAIFDGLRFYETERGPAIFRLTEHVERLLLSAEKFGYRLPYSCDNLCQAVIQTIRANPIQAGYIRPIAFWGEGDMELQASQASQHVAIAIWPWAARLGHASIRVKISSFLRTPPQSTVIFAKLTGHYANSILARQEARKEGYQEALFLDYEGNIAEGPGANFFAVKNGVLFTPPEAKIFAGITRDSIIELAKGIGISVKIEDLHPDDIPTFDEAFFAGTAVEIVPIESINEIKIKNAPGTLTTQLQTLYLSTVHGKEKKMENWLRRTV